MINKYLNMFLTWLRKRNKTKKCKNCNHFDFGRCNRYPPVVQIPVIIDPDNFYCGEFD